MKQGLHVLPLVVTALSALKVPSQMIFAHYSFWNHFFEAGVIVGYSLVFFHPILPWICHSFLHASSPINGSTGLDPFKELLEGMSESSLHSLVNTFFSYPKFYWQFLEAFGDLVFSQSDPTVSSATFFFPHICEVTVLHLFPVCLSLQGVKTVLIILEDRLLLQ